MEGYIRSQPIYTDLHSGRVTGPEYGRGHLPPVVSENLHLDPLVDSPVKSWPFIG
jgi:hypothetical protein